MGNMKDIKFTFTTDQQEMIAEQYNKDLSKLEEYQIAELLDEFISDSLLLFRLT